MFRPFMRERLIVGVSGLADVLERLLKNVPLDDPIWDRRPVEDRFTLREVIAHLADYEAVWLERISRSILEDDAILPPIDREQMAIDNDYAHSDVTKNIAVIRERRPQWVNLLPGLTEEGWQRVGQIPEPIGPATVESQAAFVCVHDAYHTAQIAEWLAM